MCTSDVQTLYVADADDGRPVYAQWLVRRPDQSRLQAETPDAHDALAEGEILLEGAYTFVAFRGVGAMADGMGQLLRIARDEGAVAAITYVRDETSRPFEAVLASGSTSTTSASTRRASAAAGVTAARSRPRRCEAGAAPSARRYGPDETAGLGRRRRLAADHEPGARRSAVSHPPAAAYCPVPASARVAWAAARRASGTRNGEQLT